MKVIGIGDNVCDKYVHLQTMYPGGQALNFAVYTKMLGADSSYMGVFGRDEAADHVIRTLDELKVERSRCRQHDGENGYARVTLVDGDRVFLNSNKGGIAKEKPLDLSEEDLAYLTEFTHIHTTNNSHFDSQLPKLSERGFSVSYDFSGQWTNEEKVAAVLPYVSYVFLSCGAIAEEEAKEICRTMHDKGAQMVIATRGSYGAMLYDGQDFYIQPPKLVEAVDTLGAGDSFAAAFLLSYMESLTKEPDKMKQDRDFYSREIKKAMEKGAEFASETCMVRGAFGHGIGFTE